MTREIAPERAANEAPLDYLERCIRYFTEPDRRRMGNATAQQMHVAMEELQQDAEAVRLRQALAAAASTRIEAMTDYEGLGDDLATVIDLERRLSDQRRRLV